MFNRAKTVVHTLGNSAGFTLIEMLIAVSLISVATGIAGSSIFRVLSIQRFWKDDASSVRDLRHAGSWFSADALKAQNVFDDQEDVLVCDSPTDNVTLVLINTEGTYKVSYSLTGDKLVRNFDGANMIIVDGVIPSPAVFTLCDKMLTFDLEVEAGQGETETMSLRTFLRRLP